MKNKSMTIILFLWIFLIYSGRAAAFVPEQPIIKIEQVRPGMKGYALTVLYGRKISKLSLTVLSVLPNSGNPKNLILIKVPSGVAAGMSGSPVFLNGKLAGAIGYGFVNGDHTLGMVTPIEEMMSVFSWKDEKINFSKPQALQPQKLSASLSLSGAGQSTADSLSKILGTSVSLAGGGANGALPIEENARLSPGEAIMVFLVWGDVLVGSTGTLTTSSTDGKFIAFAHPFLELGAVSFPIGRATIHHIVQNNNFPFKIGSPVSFVGAVLQDRQQGVGGRVGYFPPSVAVSMAFRDTDSGRFARKGFNIVQSPFITPKMIGALFSGLIKEEWGRNAHGTLSTTFSVEGRGVEKAWRRSNMFFAESAAPDAASREIATIAEIFLLNAFHEIFPIGFSLNVEVTESARVLYIEGISFDKKSAAPGETVEVSVSLRPWRKAQQVRSFDLKIPEKASGTCEVVVRGGSVNPEQQTALVEGWKSIDSFERLIKELDSVETNNDLIVEFDAPGQSDDKNSPPEEFLFLSEQREKRLKEGSIKIFKSEYVVEGLMRKQFDVLDGGKK